MRTSLNYTQQQQYQQQQQQQQQQYQHNHNIDNKHLFELFKQDITIIITITKVGFTKKCQSFKTQSQYQLQH